VTPGERYDVVVPLTNHVAHRFATGHRIGLIVTASNAPRFDPNPGNGDPLYTTADASVAVTNTLFLDGASFVTVPVAP
jgi:predicted acyl esterase